jgi:hypothetical protein
MPIHIRTYPHTKMTSPHGRKLELFKCVTKPVDIFFFSLSRPMGIRFAVCTDGSHAGRAAGSTTIGSWSSLERARRRESKGLPSPGSPPGRCRTDLGRRSSWRVSAGSGGSGARRLDCCFAPLQSPSREFLGDFGGGAREIPSHWFVASVGKDGGVVTLPAVTVKMGGGLFLFVSEHLAPPGLGARSASWTTWLTGPTVQ